MNQAPTSPTAEHLSPTAPHSATPAPAPAAALASPAPARPAARRVRYWEQLDPASHSLYPVD